MKTRSNFLPMLNNIFRRNIVYFILWQIAVFLVNCGVVISNIGMSMVMLTNSDTGEISEIAEDMMEYYSSLSAGFTAFLCISGGFILTVLMFRGLFSKRASDMFFSLPVKRNEYFNAAFLFGIISIAVSHFISIAVAVFATKVIAGQTRKLYEIQFPFYLQAMAVSFFAACAIFALFVLCAVLSGKKAHYVLLCFITVLEIPNAAQGVLGYINSVWGLWIAPKNLWALSPASVLLSEFNGELKRCLLICAVLLLHTIIIYIAGLIVFKHRKAEVAEVYVSGRILPAVLITVLLIGVSFRCLCMYELALAVKIVIAFIAVAIAAVIMSAAFYKNRITKLTAGCVIVTVILSIAVIAGSSFGLTKSYVEYVPESAEVESVKIVNNNGNYSRFSVNFEGYLMTSVLFPYDYDSEDVFTFKGEEAKDKINAFHKKLVSEEITDAYYHNEFDDVEQSIDSIDIEYTLKNGEKVHRAYTVQSDKIVSEYTELMKTDEALDQIFPPDYVKSLSVWAEDNTEYPSLLIDSDHYDGFLSALKTDAKNLTDQDFCACINTGFELYYDYEDQIDKTVMEIQLTSVSSDIPEEELKKIMNMNMEEAWAYEEEYLLKAENKNKRLIVDKSIIVFPEFAKTIEYIKSLG